MRDATKTREKIERSALKLFARNGLDGTSVRDIARDAAVSLGAISNHFPSKDELAWQVYAKTFSEIGNELYRRAHAERSPERKLRAMIAYVFQCADSDSDSIIYLFIRREDFVARLPRGVGNPFLAFRDVIQAGMNEGVFERQNLNVSTTLVVGMINQLVDAKVNGFLRGNLQRLVETVTRVTLKMLKA